MRVWRKCKFYVITLRRPRDRHKNKHKGRFNGIKVGERVMVVHLLFVRNLRNLKNHSALIFYLLLRRCFWVNSYVMVTPKIVDTRYGKGVGQLCEFHTEMVWHSKRAMRTMVWESRTNMCFIIIVYIYWLLNKAKRANGIHNTRQDESQGDTTSTRWFYHRHTLRQHHRNCHSIQLYREQTGTGGHIELFDMDYPTEQPLKEQADVSVVGSNQTFLVHRSEWVTKCK